MCKAWKQFPKNKNVVSDVDECQDWSEQRSFWTSRNHFTSFISKLFLLFFNCKAMFKSWSMVRIDIENLTSELNSKQDDTRMSL